MPRTGVVDNLDVRPDAMRTNLERLGGAVFSEQVLLSLADQPERRLQVATDGLHPFTVEAAP